MYSKWWLSFALVLLVIGSVGAADGPQFGEPFPGLPQDVKALFDAGVDEFSEPEEANEGLGPVFNDVSCVACHSNPAVGGDSTITETRFGRMKGGKFDPMTEFGGSLLQVRGLDPIPRTRAVPSGFPQRPRSWPSARRPALRAGTRRQRAGRCPARHRRRPAVPDAGDRRGGEHRDRCDQRAHPRRPVRLEGAGGHAGDVLGGRVPERDGHYLADVSDRTISPTAAPTVWNSATG